MAGDAQARLLLRGSLVRFCVLSFVVSWLLFGVNLLRLRVLSLRPSLWIALCSLSVPAAAALFCSPSGSRSELLRSTFRVTKRAVWPCSLAFFIPLSSVLVGEYLMRGMDSASIEFSLPVFVGAFVVCSVTAALGEIGWRGFAFPRAIALLGDSGYLVRSSALVGALWALWRLPEMAYTLPSVVDPWDMLDNLAARSTVMLLLSICLGYTFKASGGRSLLHAVIAHASLEASTTAVLGASPDGTRFWWYSLALLPMALVCTFACSRMPKFGLLLTAQQGEESSVKAKKK